ncbi:MAG: sigma-54 dependent transcriptional regulator [Pirellulaceae bacterium]
MSKPPDLFLIVDDEPSICWALQRRLRERGAEVLTASSAEEGLALAESHKPCMVLLDVRLPGEDGISALPKFITATGGAPVVVMTAFGDLETAVAAVKKGAFDYLTKPFRLEDVDRVCQAGQIRRRFQSQSPSPASPNQPPRLIGTSPAIQQAFRQIALVADSELSVLITGETGTGKELVADAIHRHSRRADQPYLAIAPVALNADLIESELFGHVRGAFTGASTDRAGLFEQADGGTILLDEIGELPLAIQAKLLRVLEQGEYSRVGEVSSRRCNVRILAATNANLHRAVEQNTFREDLFYRLNGMHIHLPPLRERTEDILPLCEYFLTRVGHNNTAAISDELLARLQRRPWPGNVRELRNAIEHAAVVARGRELSASDFPEPTDDAQTPGRAMGLEDIVRDWAHHKVESTIPEELALHAQFLADIEPTLFQFALEYTGGNRVKAAELLGIHRGTLRDRLRIYGIED